MRVIFIFLLLCCFILNAFKDNRNEGGLQKQNRSLEDSIYKVIGKLYTLDYLKLKKKIIEDFPNATPGKFGQFVKGVYEDLSTNKKVLALTFDACGGKSNGYNAELINYLRAKKIPATLFVSGLWIDANPKIFKELVADTLFEIENHGLFHRLCSLNGETKYGIIATENIGDVVDEMELNARKMEKIMGYRPKYFRSATAWTDETCAKVANRLGMEIVSYEILSGDAIPFTPPTIIKDNIVKPAKNGAIIIMHFNHPDWYEKEALQMAIPILKEKGFSFVKLEYFKLKERE